MRFVFETWIKPIIKMVYLRARTLALGGLRPFLSGEGPFPKAEGLRSILMIRVDRVGDMVLSTPVFEAVKAALPQTRLTVMASVVNASILKHNPHVDEVIVYDRSAPLFQRVRFLRGLRARRFDLAVDLLEDYELKSAWIAWMSGAIRRIGYAASGREVFFHASIPRPAEGKHFTAVTMDLLKLLDVRFDMRPPSLYLDEAERAWARRWVNEKGLHGKMIVAVHPGATYETQRWPPEYFADLIGMILERKEAGVILFGAPADAGLMARIQALVRKPVSVSLESDIRRFLALLPHCRMLVCNNSGPLHCAAALHVPTISFMGPTSPDRWAPVGDRHHVLRQDELLCIGCNLGRCKIKTHECMRRITPETVIRLIGEEIQ